MCTYSAYCFFCFVFLLGESCVLVYTITYAIHACMHRKYHSERGSCGAHADTSFCNLQFSTSVCHARWLAHIVQIQYQRVRVSECTNSENILSTGSVVARPRKMFLNPHTTDRMANPYLSQTSKNACALHRVGLSIFGSGILFFKNPAVMSSIGIYFSSALPSKCK